MSEEQKPVPDPSKQIQVMDHVLKQLLEYTENLSGKMPGLAAGVREAWKNLCLAAWPPPPPPEPKVDHDWVCKAAMTAHDLIESWGEVTDMYIGHGPELVVVYAGGALVKFQLAEDDDTKAYFEEFQQEMVSREDDRE